VRGEQRLPPARRAAVRQRPAAGVHRAEEQQRQAARGLRRQPDQLQGEIPQLFAANALCLLSNGIETKVGSLSAEWEHFFNWLRVDDEKESADRKAIADQGH
jgi:type I site-specific restriction-modification system R (restriction) subunit